MSWLSRWWRTKKTVAELTAEVEALRSEVEDNRVTIDTLRMMLSEDAEQLTNYLAITTERERVISEYEKRINTLELKLAERNLRIDAAEKIAAAIDAINALR